MTSQTEDVRGREIAELKKEYHRQIQAHTPDEIKEQGLFDLKDPLEQKFTLTKSIVESWKIESWLANYKKEALVSTGGIRGPQNILYPWDTRYPIHRLGVSLATLGKALVLKEDIHDRNIEKLCSGEVRYNTDDYISLIRRIQAAEGLITHSTPAGRRTSIWMASFLIFMLDYDGGEYVTSSHGISSKIATKDLDNQGSQFIPEMSARFVRKIQDIVNQAKTVGYTITLAPLDHPLLREDVDGTALYVEYLKKGIATEQNLNLIRDAAKDGLEILYECVGGCMHAVMLPIFRSLGIEEAYRWNNSDEDPFFHGIGKTMVNPVSKKREFYDYGCDTTIREVVETLGYDKLLLEKEPGYVVIMVDPDGDRIVIGQIESRESTGQLDKLGIPYIDIGPATVFTYYTPNQSFLMTMDFHATHLKESGQWDNHPRFIITTTPSAASWVEWAEKTGVQYLYVPVGFKEIANILKKVENQIVESPESPVVVEDIFGRKVDLGIDPRLVFTGEESGGMITGPEELIRSKKGRIALAMREKSAGEATIIVSAMIAHLHKEKKRLSEYLSEIFEKHAITRRYDIRIEKRFYNESNPDPDQLRKDKAEGEKKRDRIDSFFLSIALSVREGQISTEDAKSILREALPELDFSNLTGIYFVGDGTYFDFDDKYVEIRKSGTDAIIKAYSAGEDKDECIRYATQIASYNGRKTPLFKTHITDAMYTSCNEKAMSILREFQRA